MKLAANIAGALLGIAFIAFGLMFLTGNMPKQPDPPAGSLTALFMGALAPSGYLKFVKILEVLGGLLVAIPKFRNWGLLVLGPIIVNILAFHVFIAQSAGEGLPVLVLICALAGFLLLSGRKAFVGLLN